MKLFCNSDLNLHFHEMKVPKDHIHLYFSAFHFCNSSQVCGCSKLVGMPARRSTDIFTKARLDKTRNVVICRCNPYLTVFLQWLPLSASQPCLGMERQVHTGMRPNLLQSVTDQCVFTYWGQLVDFYWLQMAIKSFQLADRIVNGP